MRIIGKDLKKGFVKVIPESFDDLWHLYNVIYRGDEVFARTTRVMKPDEKYARPGRGERVTVNLGVKVESVGWDKLLGRLRVHGTISQAPETVPEGAHHTLNIGLNTPLTVLKKEWARHHLDRLDRAVRSSEKSLIILSIDDEGYALATTAQYGIDVRIEERTKLPGKLEAERRSNAVAEYFTKATNCLREVWQQTHCAIVIIGVGFVKNDFAKFLRDNAAELAKHVADVKSVNNGGVAGIQESLRSGILLGTQKQLRVAEETRITDEVLRRLGKGEKTVTYGLDDVNKAISFGAVEKLLLTDSLLRESSTDERLQLENVMKDAEKQRGEIIIVSAEHEAGAQLNALGGVAGLLRFPIA